MPGSGPDYIGVAQSSASVVALSPFNTSPTLFAEAGVGCCAAEGNAGASIIDTVLISGGQGTGYLNLDFLFSQYGDTQQSTGEWSVSSGQGDYQGGSTYNHTFGYPEQLWGIATFQFGQPFTFGYSVSAGADSSDPGGADIYMWFSGAQVYTSQPTQCGIGTAGTNFYWGLCSDPNATPAGVLGTIYAAVPEPGSVWLTLGSVPLLPIIRRLRGAMPGQFR